MPDTPGTVTVVMMPEGYSVMAEVVAFVLVLVRVLVCHVDGDLAFDEEGEGDEKELASQVHDVLVIVLVSDAVMVSISVEGTVV